jgi:hypothetical protein
MEKRANPLTKFFGKRVVPINKIEKYVPDASDITYVSPGNLPLFNGVHP